VSALRKSIAVPPDAVEILTEDHNRIKDLFRAFEKLTLANDVNAKKELVEEISNELSIHTQMELEIFYEAARKSLHVHYLLDEAEFEHASMTEIIAQLRELDPGDEVYVTKVSLLRAYVNHHFIKEEDKIFPKIRRTNIDLQVLGDELIQRKQELLVEYGLDES
jgi:iron-sulfur cluster repair protein YtfE (RIC family)